VSLKQQQTKVKLSKSPGKVNPKLKFNFLETFCFQGGFF